MPPRAELTSARPRRTSTTTTARAAVRKVEWEEATGREDAAVRLTPLVMKALSQFFFGPEGFIKDSFGMTEGFTFQFREARKRLRAGERPFFLYPMRIFQKEAKVEIEREKKLEAFSLDEQRITEIMNRMLAEMGPIKGV
jgi:hypothetical protein